MERWREIPGYEGGYEVSSLGRVRSVNRKVHNGRGSRLALGRVLSPGLGGNGYYSVQLWHKGKSVTRAVHTLVAEAFIGPRLEGMDVCHNDGDSTNNNLSNLRYDTRSENLKDAVKHRTNWQSAKNACPRGHPFDVFNLNSSAGRSCRACNSEKSIAWREKRDFDPSRADSYYRKFKMEHEKEAQK